METVVNDTEKREEQKTVIVRDFYGTTESLKKLNQIIKDNQKMVIIVLTVINYLVQRLRCLSILNVLNVSK